MHRETNHSLVKRLVVSGAYVMADGFIVVVGEVVVFNDSPEYALSAVYSQPRGVSGLIDIEAYDIIRNYAYYFDSLYASRSDVLDVYTSDVGSRSLMVISD